jgi:hypothetical protein
MAGFPEATVPGTQAAARQRALLLTIAHHEAAHAIVALRLGGRVDEMVIRRQLFGPWSGFTCVLFPDGPDGERAGAITAHAGVIGERFWQDKHDLRVTDLDVSAVSDRAIAEEHLARIPRRQRPTVRAVADDAERLVTRHFGHIEDLAHRLFKVRRLVHVTR